MAAIVFFDDYCFLCTGVVKYLLKAKSFDHFYFAPLNGETYLKLSHQIPSDLSEIEFYFEEKFYSGFDALVEILRAGHSPRWIVFLLSKMPKKVGDFIYRLIANNRPRSETCLIIQGLSQRVLK